MLNAQANSVANVAKDCIVYAEVLIALKIFFRVSFLKSGVKTRLHWQNIAIYEVYMKFTSIFLPILCTLSACSSSGNASKNSEVKYDYVAGYSGEDKVIITDDNASIHSDRDAVKEYTLAVDTINGERQRVEGDLAGLVLCRKKQAAAKGITVPVGPLTVPCMEKAVMERDRAGEDLMQVQGKLVLRKKDDFKARLDESRSCLAQVVSVRDKARQDYMLEGCDSRVSQPKEAPSSAD